MALNKPIPAIAVIENLRSNIGILFKIHKPK